MTTIYFVRHAQPDYRGGSDRERGLTAEAMEDRRIVLDFLRDKPVDAFWCSPYRCSMDTIREAAEHFRLPIRTDERLREREAAPAGNVRELFRKRWADFDWHEPGGECLRAVQERNIAALTDILTAERDRTVVIGTHGTALSTMLDFEGTRYLSRTERVHVEKIFKQ